nr:hypothetical protein [Thiocapsa sp. KS1]
MTRKTSAYAIRTCKLCGKRLPANEMVAVEKKNKARGHSRSGISLMTWIGAALEDKNSRSAINRWFFNSSKRVYKGDVAVTTIRVCPDCAEEHQKLNGSNKGFFSGCLTTILIFFFIVGVLLVASLFIRVP